MPPRLDSGEIGVAVWNEKVYTAFLVSHVFVIKVQNTLKPVGWRLNDMAANSEQW